MKFFIMFLLQGLFLALKLTGTVAWSWWVVFVPLIVWVLWTLYVLIVLVWFIHNLTSKKGGK